MRPQTQYHTISGMSCQSCVGRIEAAIKPLIGDGEELSVTLNPPALHFSGRLEFATLANAVAKAGTPGKYQLIATANVAESATAPADPNSWLITYRPLLTILAFIIGVTLLAQHEALLQNRFDGMLWMQHFMAGFFIVFAFFKLLDVATFANAYRGYDLVAARIPAWGTLYPFVELALGIAYLINFKPILTNAVTLVVMSVSAIGVIRAVLKKQEIRCACLGSVFNLPMSTVTIVEDVAMAAMAAWMLAMLL
jgi:copper chaperone CopZ